MKQGLVTIVVPVYNTEKYLCRCLSSIVQQTYQNIEILLIDDGATDRCPQICEEWAQKDGRIKVIHKKNAGLGMARNTGIENAEGEYICFFDSDDYIDSETIEKSYHLASSAKADVVCFGYHKVSKQGKIVKSFIPQMPKDQYEGDEIYSLFLPELIQNNPENEKRTNLHMSAWASLYSMENINRTGWRFVSEREIISEDYYSLLYFYKDVKKVAVLEHACYFYCENEGSLTHTYKKDRYARIRHYYLEALKVCEDLQYGEEVKKRLCYTYFANTFGALKQIMASDSVYKEKRHLVKEIVTDTTCEQVLGKIKNDKLPFTWKVFLRAMYKKRVYLCCTLLSLKNIRNR